MELGLRGRCAAVTGATRGIGRATAHALAAEGANVAVCARGAEGVVETVAELEAMGVAAVGDAVDVADTAALTGWVERSASVLGGLDVLVANASALHLRDEPEAWTRSFEVDLLHAVRACEAALPRLRASDAGAIVLVSSVSAALVTRPAGQYAYGALKAGLASYGAHLARQVAADGIRVNVVSPGAILFDGGVWDDVRRDDPGRFAAVVDGQPLGRLGSPDEVARAIAFLASPAASYVTGVNLRVDGGALGRTDV